MITSNEYFEGKVKSLGLKNDEGRSTVGIMVPGDYTFGTTSIEVMHVITGAMEVQLPQESEWTIYEKGSEFRVEKGQQFKVKVHNSPVAYWCQYF